MKDNHPAIQKFLNAHDYFPDKPSVAELFQYTQSGTLKSLLDNKSVWATEHRYLNDPTEFNHGMSLFLQQLLAFFTARNLDQFFNPLMTFLQSEINNPSIKIFISSFTEDGDLLSQWRGYGDSGKGISIGFQASSAHLEQNRTSFWCEVIYDDNQKVAMIAQVMQDFGQAWNSLPNSIAGTSERITFYPNKQDLIDLIIAFIQVAAIHSVKFKNYAWREEKEWRLVKLVFPGQTTSSKVRSRGSELIEYYEIPVQGNFISSIFVGPRSNFISQKQAIEALRSPPLKVLKSTIPWV